MALITKPYTFASGALILAAEHNSNFDTIYTDYNGGITNANISASAAIATTKLSGTISPANGGTGVANNASSTITITGSFALGITLTAGTAITLPTSGTLYASGSALGTPSSGTLTNCTGLPIAGLTASTSTALGVGSIELGHATDTTIARSGAGAITVEGVQVILSGAALGTPSSGTLTNCTGLPVAGITSSTSTALGVGSIELGAASDTTLSRSAAGVLAVEGVVVPSISSTNTLTNKRVTNRVLALSAGSATPAINTDSYDVVHITAQSAAITSFTSSLTGTPVDGDTLRVSVTDNGTARALTWGASFESSGTVTLPSTTVISTRLDVGFFWNTETSKWRCVGVA